MTPTEELDVLWTETLLHAGNVSWNFSEDPYLIKYQKRHAELIKPPEQNFFQFFFQVQTELILNNPELVL